MKFSIIIAALGLILLATKVTAQTENTQHEQGQEAQEEQESKHGHHGRGHSGPGRHQNKMAHMMNKVDLNEDGQVDLNEYLQSAEQRFSMMDGNGDGVVTRDEMHAAGKTMRAEHRKAMKEARKAYKESRTETE